MTQPDFRQRRVRIEGLEELQKKLNADILVQPEMDAAMQTFTDRIINRPGKGLGAQRNALSDARTPLATTVTSTLKSPRTTGRAWGRKNENIIKGMASRVITKAVSRIEARWSA